MANQNRQEFLLDVRINNRSLRDGKIDRKVYEEFIKDLPDLADQCDDIGEEIYGAEKSEVALAGDILKSEHEED